MQPHQSSRVDLGELKAQIVKKIGVDRSKRYFYNLNRFLSQKLSKSEFDKSYYRVLGRENLPLHNQLIRTILKNASHAKIPPPFYEAGPAKTLIQTSKASSPSKEDGHEQSGSLIPAQNQDVHIWSNGVLPVSPRKGRSGIRDRKLRDRPSPLGPNGKVKCALHQSTGTEDSVSKGIMENGELIPCDYQRPLQLLQPVAEQPEHEKEPLVTRTSERARIAGKDNSEVAVVEDREEVEQGRHSNFSKKILLAPLGIPFYAASIGGARKAIPVATVGEFFSCYDSSGLSDTETLRKRMEQIATTQGTGGVSLECANTLNNMLDMYLKRLIRSCVQLVGGRSAQFAKPGPTHKQQVPGKIINGIWPSNHLHMQSSSELMDCMLEQKSRCSISVLDFKIAMELNPQQLGEDWPLLLEKICMQSFEE